ncbi:hypothetical protein ACFYTQ_01485 [Nocardia sp. NPDC004068]|uniref:hypothetical protein n=1 Tax=Nocardia sp. NPDC004068 TaxID=3364303 RepID=UPI0036B69002
MTDDLLTAPVTGTPLPVDRFRVHRTARTVDVDRVLDVLDGRLAAYLVSEYVSAADCSVLTANFANSTDRIPRYGEGADGVEAYVLGASHIEKTTDQYLDQAAATAPAMRALYTGVHDPVSRLRELLLASGALTGRPAEHDGRRAGDSKAVCWNNIGEYLLLPHDDLAQLSDPLQAGFEIQTVRRVLAINVYPHVPGAGGALRIWNVAPDHATRARLGLTHSGYPYPPELLTAHPALDIPVHTGDLCLINGNLIHAVLGGDDRDRGRLLLTCFSGVSDQGEFLWWT